MGYRADKIVVKILLMKMKMMTRLASYSPAKISMMLSNEYDDERV
jgi:hypothetical protein